MATVQTQPQPLGIRTTSWQSIRGLLKKARRHRAKRSSTTITVGEKKDVQYDSAVEIVESPNKTEYPHLQFHKALVVAEKGQYEVRHSHPVPHLDDDEVMIRNHCVGLNPIDWKSVDYNFCLPKFPWVTGREMSGVVHKVGKNVKNLSAGDRVWTSTYYRDVRAGCFQELVVVPEHTVLPIPANLDFESAACLGVAALTAGMALWKWLGVPLPETTGALKESHESDWLLIWGGSTVTGQFATQYAIASGLNVITVTSERTKNLSQRLGATHVVSRDGKSDDEIVSEIKAVTGGKVTRAIDLVGPKTATLVLQCVSETFAVEFAPLAMMSSKQVVPENVTAHTVEMKQFVLDRSNTFYAEELNRMLQSGELKLPEIHVMDGGLEVVVSGLDMLKKGDMGGKKMVVRMQ
ncbi:GroES-like protein [Mytilinidion resinicola]|uniref:GroES-like protein n=1 Tax=Mytilinidion resinicola TaxID=574789 RepID=A0A6A6YKT8_9PEZI|nr:GroES-like protein [Mytilinidion resinicola]KAF2808487.1 GroES-like protein [Mytilinidion resinicola]